MAACVHEIDKTMFKVHRAASRARSLHKKRAEFERSRGAASQEKLHSAAPPGRGDKPRARPHRVARAATRTCLAKGLVEVAADMPTIVCMDSTGWRSPSVAARISYAAAPTEPSDIDIWSCTQGCLEEYTISAACVDAKECFSVDMADTDSTASGESNSDVSEFPPMLGKDESASAPKKTVDDHVEETDGSSDASNTVEDVPHVPDEQLAVSEEHFANAEAGRPLTRREAVLCNLARTLRAHATEERMRAQAAEAEQQLLRAKCKQHGRRPPNDLKEGVRCQQQLAASFRRRRNQEAHIAALKQKADRAFQEAREAKEQAEAEAIATRARHLALANFEAQEHAASMAAAEVAKVQGEADDLAQRRLAEIATIEAAARAKAQAEAYALKLKAETEALATKSQAKSLQAHAQLEVQQLKFRAEVEARVIKARAEMEVRETRAQVEAKLDELSRDAQAAARAAQEESKTAEASSPKESTSSLLRQAKLLQRQKAQQHRKEAEQERRREQLVERELQERRAKAEEEASSVVARAVATAEALKAKAREEVQAAKARAEAQGRRTAEEAEAIRLEAEELARDIKAKAEQEAQALVAQKVTQQARTQAKVEAPEAEAGSQDAYSGSKGEWLQPAEEEWEVLLDINEDPDAGDFGWKVIA